jgi:hypothetical protein
VNIAGAAAARYAEPLAELEHALTVKRSSGRSTVADGRAGQRAAVLVCGCGSRGRSAGGGLKPRRIICGACGTLLSVDATR